MEKVSVHKGISEADFAKIMRWTNARDEAFLRQFAGDKAQFPLRDKKLLEGVEATYSVFSGGEFVGMLQIIRKQDGNVHIGRFLIDPGQAGRGIGSRALTAFCELQFMDVNVESISLNVYKFNIPAQKSYLKCGFSVVDEGPGDDEWALLHMKKYR